MGEDSARGGNQARINADTDAPLYLSAFERTQKIPEPLLLLLIEPPLNALTAFATESTGNSEKRQIE